MSRLHIDNLDTKILQMLVDNANRFWKSPVSAVFQEQQFTSV